MGGGSKRSSSDLTTEPAKARHTRLGEDTLEGEVAKKPPPTSVSLYCFLAPHLLSFSTQTPPAFSQASGTVVEAGAGMMPRLLKGRGQGLPKRRERGSPTLPLSEAKESTECAWGLVLTLIAVA
jgi:hypothetical protein